MLDDDLLSFVRASTRSTWALELLLLLMREQHAAGLSADELVRALRGSPTLVATCLEQLQDAGLLVHDEMGRWRYAPSSDALRDLAGRLQSVYAERPLAVINAIIGSPNERLKSFSDAFRFPKKGD